MSSPVEEIKHEKKLLLKKYLQESNGRRNSFIEWNKDAIFVVDLEGHFVQVN